MHIKSISRPERAQSEWNLYDSSWAGLMVFIIISIVFPEKVL